MLKNKNYALKLEEKIFISVKPNIGTRSLRLQDIISLLPYPDGMTLDIGKNFQIFDGIFCGDTQ